MSINNQNKFIATRYVFTLVKVFKLMYWWVLQWIDNWKPKPIPLEVGPEDLKGVSYEHSCWQEVDFEKVKIARVSDENEAYKLICAGKTLQDNGQLANEALAKARMVFKELEKQFAEACKDVDVASIPLEALAVLEPLKQLLERLEKKKTLEVFLVDVEVFQISLNEECVTIVVGDELPKVFGDVVHEIPKAFGQHDYLENLEKFCVFCKFKNPISFRTFSTSAYCREENRRVFVREVLNAIQLLLKQQGSSLIPPMEYIEELAGYQEDSLSLEPDTLSLKDLKELLNVFNINKELIRLVPDIQYTASTKKHMQVDSGCPTIQFLTPNRQSVMTISMSHYHIFQSIVCDMSCKTIDANLTEAIINEMNDMADNYEVVLVSRVEESIERLKLHPKYLEAKKKHLLTPLIKLYDADFNDRVTLGFIFSELHEHGIKTSEVSAQLKKVMVPAWKARLLFQWIWMDLFFDGDESILKRSVMNGWMHRVPIPVWDRKDDVVSILSRQNDRFVKYWKQLACEQLDDFTHSTSYTTCHEWLLDSSWEDREYISRGDYWKIRHDLPDDYEKLIGPIQEKIMSMDDEEEKSALSLLKKEIMTPFRIQKQVDQLMSIEDIKWYGTSDDAERYKDFKKAVRYMMEEETNEDSDDIEASVSSEVEHNSKLPGTTECSDQASKTLGTLVEGEEAVPTSSTKNRNKKKKRQCSQGRSDSCEKKEASKILEDPLDEREAPKKVDCRKCASASEMCNTAKAELKKSVNRNSKLEKKLSATERRLKETEEEKDCQAKLYEASLARIEALEAEFASYRQSSEASTSQLTERLSKLEGLSDEKDAAIRALRAHVPAGTAVDIKMLSDCREALLKLQDQQDEIKTTHLNGIDKANALYHKLLDLNKDGIVQRRIDEHFVDFRAKYSDYSRAVERNIKTIQETLVITRAELPNAPVKPEIPAFLLNEIDKAMRAKNQKQEQVAPEEASEAEEEEVCPVCMVNEIPEEGFQCPCCQKKFCNPCIDDWWLRNKSCPNCRDEWR